MTTPPRAMTLRLNTAEHEALLVRSQVEQESMQILVRKAIHEYLERHPLNEEILAAHGRAIMARYGAVMQRLAE